MQDEKKDTEKKYEQNPINNSEHTDTPEERADKEKAKESRSAIE